MMEDPVNSLHFYAQGVVDGMKSLTERPGLQYVLTMEKGLGEIKTEGYQFNIIDSGKLFKVSELTPEFLNPSTRSKETKSYYLLRLK